MFSRAADTSCCVRNPGTTTKPCWRYCAICSWVIRTSSTSGKPETKSTGAIANRIHDDAHRLAQSFCSKARVATKLIQVWHQAWPAQDGGGDCQRLGPP